MRKKELELFLETIPDFSNPTPSLEQYKTPAFIAADVLFLAYGFHDITEKIVLDLGCGTGIFAIGASWLGAKKVFALDVDKDVIEKTRLFAGNQGYDISFICDDVSTFSEPIDSVLMNPPFGAQKKNIHADRLFIEKATTLAKVTYSLHLHDTLNFI